MKKGLFILFIILALVMFVVDMMVGSTSLSPRQVIEGLFGTTDDVTVVKIVRDIRLLKALAAVFAGMALTISGLQMQTLFRNPLAGPYVLGITSGASLAVAVVVLGLPIIAVSLPDWASTLSIAGAAWIGSALVLLAISLIGRRVRDIMVLLILGMMFSAGVSALVQVLQYFSREDSLKSYVIWTMGSLGDITTGQLWMLAISTVAGLVLAVVTIKSLNLLLLGETAAISSGLNIRRSRGLLFLSTTLLAGGITAFCGPIGFIGLAMPHVARAIFGTSDHRVLIPAAGLVGIVSMLLCDMFSKLMLLPLNSITSLLGIPLVIWIVLKHR